MEYRVSRMKRRIAVLTAVFLCICAGIARADLNGDIQEVLRDKLLSKATVGIEITRLSSVESGSRVIYQRQAETQLIPASNLKLVTTSAALDRLGSDFRFQTQLLQRGEDLLFWGDGDPTLGDAELLKPLGWDVTTVFEKWAQILKTKGVTKVRNIVVDDSMFDMEFFHPRWPQDQYLKWYEAEVAAINLNGNVLDFFVRPGEHGREVSYSTNPATAYVNIRNACTTGSRDAVWFQRPMTSNDITLRGEASVANIAPISITIHDGPMYAATVLTEVLKQAGIEVTGVPMRDRTTRMLYKELNLQNQWPVLVTHSTDLGTVLRRTNKDSKNLYAEVLCKRIGYEASGVGSWETGNHAMGQYLRSIGVGAGEFKLDDGCGLSKENRISANAIAKVLVHSYHNKDAKMFIDSLAIAGVDGTLDDRFRGSDLRGRVYAKSGFVNGVSALSGYIKARDDNWYAFSILMNGIPPGTNSGAKLLQERIVRAIDSNVAASTATSAR
jgi:D-alanyl-D-alanine carboxypeptidase/D-alanyl-D-alanine-endopeptidase (penicillin-binding protein 4)